MLTCIRDIANLDCDIACHGRSAIQGPTWLCKSNSDISPLGCCLHIDRSWHCSRMTPRFWAVKMWGHAESKLRTSLQGAGAGCACYILTPGVLKKQSAGFGRVVSNRGLRWNVCLFLDDRGNQRLALDGALLFHMVYRKMIINHEAAKSIPNLWGLVLIPESRKIRAMRFRFRPTRGGTALVFKWRS